MTARLRICRLVDHFPTKRKFSHSLSAPFYHISKEQAKLGNRVDVICKRQPRQDPIEIVDKVVVRRVGTPFNLKAIQEMRRLDKEDPIRIVHSHATSCFLYPLLKRYIGNQGDHKKHVVHVHATSRGILKAYEHHARELVGSISVSERFWISIAIARQEIAWKRADALIAVGTSVAEDLSEYYSIPRDRVFVVPNGIDLSLFYPQPKERSRIRGELGIEEDTPLILYLGGFRLVKGPILMLESMRHVLDAIPDAVLLFVGNTQDTSLAPYVQLARRLIDRLQLRSSVRIHELIPYERTPRYYSASDVLAMPSIYEAFGKVVVEASACGLPVVRTHTGAKEYFDQILGAGHLVGEFNPDSFGEVLVEALRLGKKRFALLQNRKHILTWKDNVKMLQEIYEQI